MTQPGGRPIEILLVEDNPGDVRLTIEGLNEGKVRNNLHVARDGVEALAFLRQSLPLGFFLITLTLYTYIDTVILGIMRTDAETHDFSRPKVNTPPSAATSQ